MVTETQQAVFDEIAKYTDIETAREHAKEIAEKVAKLGHIKSCSETYVRRLISRKEDDSATVHFKVTPKEDESEEVEPEEEEEPEPEEEPEEQEPEGLKAPAAWELQFDEDEEPEPEGEVVREIRQMDLGEIISKENCATLIATPFRMAAQWTKFKGWSLTADEEKRLTPMFRAILIKYLPTILAEYFAELIFAVVVIEVIGSKAQAYRVWQEERVPTVRAQKQTEEQSVEPEAEEPEPEKKLTKDSTRPHWLDGRSIG